MSDAIPAATLVLLREQELKPPELLMIERNGGMAFAAGALVFPGGRVDPQDREIAAHGNLVGAQRDPDEAAARIAAIRETIEEVGIAVGIGPGPDPAAVQMLRAALARGEPFGALLQQEGLRLDLDQLVAFARWRPNSPETRVFDTRFYLARSPAGQTAIPDGGESVRALWATASEFVAGADAGRHRVIFPTRRNLERLATLPSFDEGCRHVARFPVEMITPWVEKREGVPYLCIRQDQGYPVTAELLEHVKRG